MMIAQIGSHTEPGKTNSVIFFMRKYWFFLFINEEKYDKKADN